MLSAKDIMSLITEKIDHPFIWGKTKNLTIKHMFMKMTVTALGDEMGENGLIFNINQEYLARFIRFPKIFLKIRRDK